ncbi:ABC transporter permease (plasmid) [Shinella sp. PSBB067]|uniref:ABC transporter permease n=1 Tax=unclassified Shinella TaxID=2643062 RepID=UPI00193BE07F|nr:MULTISPECIES: ABC transporter permease [unclassified Shinella]QRI66241.1 ABC transporter permease [Shinella sp. PSBB067]
MNSTDATAKAATAQTYRTAKDFAHRDLGALGNLRRFLYQNPAISPAIVLLLAGLVFGLTNERFFRLSNFSLIFQQVSIVGTLAIAQTLIILTAGIDLSIGAVMIFSTVAMAKAHLILGWSGPACLAVGLLTGIVAGGLNGLLITKIKLPPFIVTLGTLSIFYALSILTTDGLTTRGTALPPALTWTGSYFRLFDVNMSYGIPLMLGLYALVAYMLKNTAFGYHIYAVGNDVEASRLVGLRPERVLLAVYMMAGAITVFAAWIFMGRINGVSPNGAVDANLDSITAVVIGGTSLFGGRGLVWGTLLGALIVGVFRNGLSLAGLDVLYQTLAVGILIIVAVALDQWIRKASA